MFNSYVKGGRSANGLVKFRDKDKVNPFRKLKRRHRRYVVVRRIGQLTGRRRLTTANLKMSVARDLKSIASDLDFADQTRLEIANQLGVEAKDTPPVRTNPYAQTKIDLRENAVLSNDFLEALSRFGDDNQTPRPDTSYNTLIKRSAQTKPAVSTPVVVKVKTQMASTRAIKSKKIPVVAR